MSEELVTNHSETGTPADGQCEVEPGVNAAALGDWAGRRAQQFDDPQRRDSWSALARYVCDLPDSHPDIQFFDDRGAFVQPGDNAVEFWAAHVPPLEQAHDFLGTIGGFGTLDGPAVMAALRAAVARREAQG